MKRHLLMHLFSAFALIMIFTPFTFANAGILQLVNDGGLTNVGKAYTDKVPEDPRTTAAKYIKVLLGFTGIILTCYILYSGFLWLTAGGNAAQVTTAKSHIFNAAIGLIIIFAAYSLTNYIISFALNQPQSGTLTWTIF